MFKPLTRAVQHVPPQWVRGFCVDQVCDFVWPHRHFVYTQTERSTSVKNMCERFFHFISKECVIWGGRDSITALAGRSISELVHADQSH